MNTTIQDEFYYTKLGGNRYYIPRYMQNGLELYINHGVQPGSFLMAVLSNQLHEAYMYADDTNFRNIPAYVDFLHNHVSSNIWGSPEKIKAWVNKNETERLEKLEKQLKGVQINHQGDHS